MAHVRGTVRLSLDSSLASRYRSRSQAARAVTEAWVTENLYCPSCTADALEPTKPGTKVVDFRCPDCAEPFQLKSQSHPFQSRVLDSAYEEPRYFPDGSWTYGYSPEGRDGRIDMNLDTNRALFHGMENRIPVGVMRQVSGVSGSRAYEVLGLA